MSLRTRVMLLAVLAAVGRPPTAAADRGSVTTGNLKFSFELVRSAGKAPTELGFGVMTFEGDGYRLLYDEERHRFFGYRVKATPLPAGRFRLEIGPLTPEAIARIAKGHEKRGRKLVGESLAVEYPPPQEVHDGEGLLLELMVNPATGEKLSDVVRVSSMKKPAEDTGELAMTRAALKINGVLNGDGREAWGGVTARYVWVGLKGYGRFVVAKEPVAEYAFVPAELVDNRTIRFASGGDTFEWTSQEPIVRVGPVPEQLWVWHQADYVVKAGWYGIGGMDEVPRR